MLLEISFEIVEQAITLVTPALAIVGAIFGISQYADKKNQEFKRRIWEERKALYYEVTDYASAISISDNLESVQDEIIGFWSMYYGRLSIIEDESVYFHAGARL